MPKALVHRTSESEVMLTGWRRVDDKHFAVAARWPRNHSFYSPVAGGYHDPLLVAETLRQIGALLWHTAFQVPLGRQFVMHSLDIALEPRHLRVQRPPATLEIAVTCVDIRKRGENLTRFGYEAVFHRAGNVVARGGASSSCLTPAVYRRLRGNRPLSDVRHQLALGDPATPARVGRSSAKDVVLSPTGISGRWQLRVDTGHPVLFDHPLDHVPGMLLLEAARQATAAALGRPSYLPISITGEFNRYAELDAPCTIDASVLHGGEPDAEETVLVIGRQSDALIFSSQVIAASTAIKASTADTIMET